MHYPHTFKDMVIPLPQWAATDLDRMVRRDLDAWGNIQWLRSEMDNLQTHMYREFVRLSANKVAHHDVYVQLSCPALDYILRAAVQADHGEILVPLADFWGRVDDLDHTYEDRGYFINYYGMPTRIQIGGVTYPIQPDQWHIEIDDDPDYSSSLPQYMKDVPPWNIYTVMGHEVTRMMLGYHSTTFMGMYSPHPIEEFVWRMGKAVEDGSLVRKLKKDNVLPQNMSS